MAASGPQPGRHAEPPGHHEKSPGNENCAPALSGFAPRDLAGARSARLIEVKAPALVREHEERPGGGPVDCPGIEVSGGLRAGGLLGVGKFAPQGLGRWVFGSEDPFAVV